MDDLYDEFGNYLGDRNESESATPDDSGAPDAYLDGDDGEDDEDEVVNDQQLMQIDDGPSNAVILHEDKQYYPSASDVYGPGVETIVHEEDAQPLSQPIIEPIKEKSYTVQERDLPPLFYSRQFMQDLLNYPEATRNVAVAGHLHHGKTAFMDMLVRQTHDLDKRMSMRKGQNKDAQLRYTDIHVLERERGLSIKAAPMTLVLQDVKQKSHALNIIDTPGHVNFADEVACSMRLADGLVLVVDVVEGVQAGTEQIIKHAVLEDLPIVLVVNKMDRLILELKIPANDAYFKVKHVIEEVNTYIENVIPGKGEKWRVSPEKGNVAFASSSMQWVFTLQSMALKYHSMFGGFDPAELAKRFWGDITYDARARKFQRKKPNVEGQRSFVTFILDPIYKLYSNTLSQTPTDLARVLARLDIKLKTTQLKGNPKDLLSAVCAQFFGGANGFVDMLVKHVPSPIEGAQRMLERHYTGPLDSDIAKSVEACDPEGPLLVQITKLFHTPDAVTFQAFGRVMSGTVKENHAVRVLGEAYTAEDEEDMLETSVEGVFIAESRYNVPTSAIPAGNFVLLTGIDNGIAKTATIVDTAKASKEDAHIFRPIKHFFEPVFKVAVEPVNPSELPKMLEALRKTNKSYPLLTTKVEESGEHVVLGTGELYMDCVLHDLRRLYSEMEIKVSDPTTRFCETCVDQSAVKCYANTPNKKNRVTLIAEPLDDGIATDIETGRVNIRDPVKTVGRFFEQNYGYDVLAARNIWAFGPDEKGANILQNDTLPGEVDAKALRSVRDSIRQGFVWATREGPLCEEPIRNTKFKLTDVALAQEAIARGGGQIIPTARRACYASLLLASPRLMEPVFQVSILGQTDAVAATYTLLSKRRGHVTAENNIPGSPLQRVRGLLPVIDSFGFETDLRMASQGQANVSMVFDRWSVVPGDPLDRSVSVRKLEPATATELARDFVLKTRRRKGLKEDIGVGQYLETELVEKLRGSGMLDG